MKRIHLNKEPSLHAKYDAFPYQKEAVEAIKDLNYAAIFHEQGLGKTKIAIDLMLYWLENTSIDCVLIVTKKQLVSNWKREFGIHTVMTPGILDTDSKNNHYVFCGPYRAIITNFEVLKSEKDQMILFLKTRNVAIIIDESTKIKNPESKISKTFFELSPLFKKRVIMTGTPVANRPYDIWSQIYFLDHGKSLGTDFKKFKKNTNLSNNLDENISEQEKFENSVSSIYKKIEKFSVRETKDSGIIHLPNKIYISEKVILTRKQKILYQKIRDELRVEILKDGHYQIDDASPVVKRLLRLVQVASNPRLVDESYREESAKEKKLNSLLDQILGHKEKCIVWSNFIGNIDYFYKKYKNLGCVKIHGKMNIEERNKSVNKFYKDDYKILFATPASAKEGLTLTMANHVIFYDRGFSLDDYLQAQDRIHRISQKKTCYIHNIIAIDSIDEWVDALLQAKQDAAHLAQGDISLKKYKEIADFSFGELIKRILNTSEDREM